MIAAYYNEISPYAAQWIRNLIAAGLITQGEVDTRSIVDVRPLDLRGFDRCHFFAGIGVWDYALGLAGWRDRPVWTGSCPCQPFSAAGRGAGFDDERHLWPSFFHLIRECRPATVLGEQVASKDGLGWLDLVQADLEGEGYAVGAADLCAAGVGAPHIRQRLWFVADAADARQRYAQDAGADRRDPRTLQGRGQGQSGLRQSERGGADGFVGDAGSEGRGQVGSDCAGRGEGSGAQGLAERSLHERPRGYWTDADWIPCRDGKARPVEPKSFPLVDGVAFQLGSGSPLEGKSRAGMLKAYGNAINARAAETFIQSVMEVRP